MVFDEKINIMCRQFQGCGMEIFMKKLWKKVLTLTLCGLMMFSLAACAGTSEKNTKNKEDVMESGQSEAGETITLKTRNGAGEMVEVDFPKNPKRLAVMDLGVLDILDNLEVGDRIVGVAKGSSIAYLQSYLTDDSLLNLGTVKEPDLEAVMECEPDIIFVGGRMAEMYDELAKIAPVYMIYTDMKKGTVESTSENAKNIASLFEAEDRVDALMGGYDARISKLNRQAKGKTALVGMVNAGGFSLLGNDGRCSLIGREIGFENIGVEAAAETSTHGNEASFELVLEKNPDYIFALDRDAAIGTQGAKLAEEVLDNELVNKTKAAKNGHVIVLEHSDVWYTAEGGITALGIMISDIEAAME